VIRNRSEYKVPDRYAQAAKEHGYRSRAAWKLIEIDRRYKITRGVNRALDLGCAPGSWLQVLSQRLRRPFCITGIDLLPVLPFIEPAISIIRGDIEDSLPVLTAKSVQLVVSDMAPNTSGVGPLDHHRSLYLCYLALGVVRGALERDGSFVCKVFDGSESDELYRSLCKDFRRVFRCKPAASRDCSREFYMVGLGYRKSE
jgi:23S rRNA (uridine2552-2'-O)-methyltransferase